MWFCVYHMPENTWESTFSRMMIFWPKIVFLWLLKFRFESEKNFSPPFFPSEKVLAPLFFFQKKSSPPFFLPKKTLSPPFFLSKKVPAPLSVLPARVPYKFWTFPKIVLRPKFLGIYFCILWNIVFLSANGNKKIGVGEIWIKSSGTVG